MKYPDVIIKVSTEYEFWDKTMRYIQSVIDLPPLPERPYAMYVHALASTYDDPFVFSGMEHICRELEKQFGETMNYSNSRNYKSRIKKLGWLPNGKFPPFITRLREDFKREKEQGIRSLSLIMKITCVEC